MITKQLKVVIDTSLKAGKTMDDVRGVLRLQGFDDQRIDTIFSEYDNPQSNSMSQIKKEADLTTDQIKNNYVPNPTQVDKPVQSNNFVGINDTVTNNNIPNQAQVQAQAPNPNLNQSPPVSQSIPPAPQNLNNQQVKQDASKVTGQVLQQMEIPKSESVRQQGVLNNQSRAFAGIGNIPEHQRAQRAAREFKGGKKSMAPIIVTFIFVFLMVGGFFYWYFRIYVPLQKESQEDRIERLKSERGITSTTTQAITPEEIEKERLNTLKMNESSRSAPSVVEPREGIDPFTGRPVEEENKDDFGVTQTNQDPISDFNFTF